MDKTFEILLSENKKQMIMLSDALTRGSCNSYEEYKYMCGQLRGLEAASGIIADLNKKMETSDE